MHKVFQPKKSNAHAIFHQFSEVKMGNEFNSYWNKRTIYSKEKSMSKNIIFLKKWHFEKFINRMNGHYKMIWKLSYGN